MDKRTDKIINKILKFFKKYKFKIIVVIIAGLIYSIIHELIHSFVAKNLGYQYFIDWGLLPMIHIDLKNITINHYLLIAIAPHLLSLILLLVLFMLYLFIKKKIIFYLAIIPFLDIITNIIAIPLAIITNKPNDFLNLFILKFYYSSSLIILSSIIIFLKINNLRKKYNLRNINSNT